MCSLTAAEAHAKIGLTLNRSSTAFTSNMFLG